MNKVVWFLSLIFFSRFCLAVEEAPSSRKHERHNVISAQSEIWSGCYSKASDLCTYPDSGGPCVDKFTDYIYIERLPVGYLVRLQSTQANQNVCYFSLEMKESNEGLVSETPYGHILLLREGGQLYISSKGLDPTALGLGICGVHADIDGVSFPISSLQESKSNCRASE